jgi:DNA repair protein RadD
MPILRPYQQDLQDRIFASWRAGNRNVLATLATGGGKSLVLSDTIRKFADARKTVILVAHRKELLQQMALHVGRQQVRHRIIGSKETVASCVAEQRRELEGASYVNPSANVAIASVDTVLSRMEQLRPWLKSVDLIVCDEAHHPSIVGNHGPDRKPNKWAAVFDECPNALGLGVTATPRRADGHGLGRHTDGVFDDLVLGLQTADLIQIKALVEFECYCPTGDFDLESLRKGESGEYTQASLKAASDKSRIVGDVVEHYIRYSSGKRAIVFATDVETSARMAREFQAAGIPAASISGMTDPAVRSDVLRRFRDGRLMVVTNCSILGEGVDVVAVECVIDASPTASLAAYLQRVGRCLRPDPANPGKIAIIIDTVSNIKRHGFPDRRHNWTLDRRDKRAPKAKDPELVEVIICVTTGRPFEAIHIANCPHCGQSHVKPSGATGIGRNVEQVAGDLTKLSAEDLAELRKAMTLPDPNTVNLSGLSGGAQAGQRNIIYSKIEAQRELHAAIDAWSGIQRHKYGRSDSEILRRWYAAVGLDMITATGAAQSRADMIALTARVNEWITNA